jgi:Bax protein
MNFYNKKSLVTKLFIFCIVVFLIVFIVAPFTFLKQSTSATSTQNTLRDNQLIVEQGKTEERISKTLVVKKDVVIKQLPEKPLHEVILPNFAKISNIKEKKTAFFNFIKPAIIKESKIILMKRKRVENYLALVSLEEPLTDEALNDIALLSQEYKVNNTLSMLTQLNQLHSKIDIVPTALVLVQAANESAWGTSRFAKVGLNFFGIWCYKKNCGMIPKGRDNGEKHEVAAFQSVDQAVNRYFKNINTHNAYMIFRTIRAQLRAQNQPLQAEVLATGLIPYSERGVEYVIDINTMLRQNQAYF